ncbi:MAG: bifunctional phosphoribosyl-AMP cyclohydrolase/phosphoribosyl-ATP diphosphatase HisIE [Lachnospiraceae bacterium]
MEVENNVKQIVPCIYLYNGHTVTGWGQNTIFFEGTLEELGRTYRDKGADSLLIFDFSGSEAEHENAIENIKNICSVCEMPVTVAGNINRVEDVKKLLYAGASAVALNFSKESNRKMLEEVSKRFGQQKIAVCISNEKEYLEEKELIDTYAGCLLSLDEISDEFLEAVRLPILLHTEKGRSELITLLKKSPVRGVSGQYVSALSLDIHDFKQECKSEGIAVQLMESTVAWSEFKLNEQQMVPVIVQDYKTNEVLMLAYMNEEAFYTTLKLGKMTYWSRSRNELWTKGDTSGHFQYLKELSLDCDNDTLLAKVAQTGAACHTGHYSCFFQQLVEKDSKATNPLLVFQNVLDVILDRKEHPKEGSYTNYLFDKGIDKILKKVGEEATEIIIAAKNPNPEEIKYEISDFLYHMMVLMAEKQVSWEEITEELARR